MFNTGHLLVKYCIRKIHFGRNARQRKGQHKEFLLREPHAELSFGVLQGHYKGIIEIYKRCRNGR